jgi:hypothetical protein
MICCSVQTISEQKGAKQKYAKRLSNFFFSPEAQGMNRQPDMVTFAVRFD